MTDILIEGGRALLDGDIFEASLAIEDGRIRDSERSGGHGKLELDARGLLVLPGIVDLHGDAFERQMMPRPGVDFPVDVALVDSDRQAISNGITTVYHATTWSWEPGLRSADNARGLLEAIESMRPSASHCRISVSASRLKVSWRKWKRVSAASCGLKLSIASSSPRALSAPRRPGSHDQVVA